MPTLRLTKRSIEAFPHPPQGQVLCRDEMLRGFGVRVGSKSKVYFAEGQVKQGKTAEAISLLQPVHDSIADGDCPEDRATAWELLAALAGEAVCWLD